MAYNEIKFAINSTLGTSDFSSLDKIVNNRVEVFTENGSFKVPLGVKYLKINAIAAGGMGSGSSSGYGYGGGGYGQFVIDKFVKVNAGETIPIVVGSGDTVIGGSVNLTLVKGGDGDGANGGFPGGGNGANAKEYYAGGGGGRYGSAYSQNGTFRVGTLGAYGAGAGGDYGPDLYVTAIYGGIGGGGMGVRWAGNYSFAGGGGIVPFGVGGNGGQPGTGYGAGAGGNSQTICPGIVILEW